MFRQSILFGATIAILSGMGLAATAAKNLTATGSIFGQLQVAAGGGNHEPAGQNNGDGSAGNPVTIVAGYDHTTTCCGNANGGGVGSGTGATGGGQGERAGF
ncbi:MAG TPA: hypothetical protein VFA91_04905 [Candidatus Polarisedimenticolia bacterium]|nr:hypothetical protein [Candidatus Polarisedimenticolia bacterium]